MHIYSAAIRQLNVYYIDWYVMSRKKLNWGHSKIDLKGNCPGPSILHSRMTSHTGDV